MDAARRGSGSGRPPQLLRLGRLSTLASPIGDPRGLEVLGLDFGRVHSWLCYDLHGEAVEAGHDLRLNRLGLPTVRQQAQDVAAMANAYRDIFKGTPSEITWFPVLVTECRL